MPDDRYPAAAHSGARTRLQDLSPGIADALRTHGRERQWQRDQVVVQQGRRHGEVIACLDGHVAVYVESTDQAQPRLLRWLDPGELVGVADVLAQLPAPTTLVAHGPARTLHVTHERFITLLQQHPAAAVELAVLLSRRLCELFGFLERPRSQPLADRVQHALDRLARNAGTVDGQGHITLQITQAELALAAGASRQRVQMALKALADEGRLQLGYRRITLLPNGQPRKSRYSR